MYTPCILIGVFPLAQKEALMAAPRFDEAKVRELYAQGHSQRAMAKMLGIPKSTLATRLRAMGLSKNPQQPESISETVVEQHKRAMGLAPDPDRPESIQSVYTGTPSIPSVHISTPPDILEDLVELVAWWRMRREVLQHATAGERKTERITFHVERRWIDAIRHLADLERLTYTEIVNQAFQQFFTEKST